MRQESVYDVLNEKAVRTVNSFVNSINKNVYVLIKTIRIYIKHA